MKNRTELDFGHLHLFPGHDVTNLTHEITKFVQINSDQLISENVYRIAQAGTKPYRLKVTVELSEA